MMITTTTTVAKLPYTLGMLRRSENGVWSKKEAKTNVEWTTNILFSLPLRATKEVGIREWLFASESLYVFLFGL
jgi:hypothetical protein